jgi:hypothetical protein
MSNNTKQLLFISDIEGCLPFAISGEKQNTSLCESKQYDLSGALYKFLANGNKIAFLGDYFDKGPGAIDSIIGIHKLKKEFNGQVYIILGNRDINKLRFAYELKEIQNIPKNNDRWSEWVHFYNLYEEKINKVNSMDLIDIILTKSMGADGIAPKWATDDKIKAHNSYLKSLIHFFNKKNFDEKTDQDFQQALHTIFTQGKIVDFDEEFGVLMSHAGGFHESVFTVNYEDMINKFNLLPKLNYFQSIEYFRKELCNVNTTAATADNIPLDLAKYNTILENTIKDIIVGNEKPIPEYYLLQASGLKPDASVESDTDNKEKFASFIQSCGSGCGLNHQSMYQRTITPSLNKILNAITINGKPIKSIAHGHVPMCLPFPLIVQYEVNGIVFIQNDTSNGQKPTEYVGESINDLPFSYIDQNNGTLEYKIGNLNDNGILVNYENDKLIKDHPILANKFPILANSVPYKWTGFTAIYKPPSNQQSSSGGKSRRKSKRKSRKNRRKSHRRRHRCSRC